MSLIENLSFMRKWQMAFRDASRLVPIENVTPYMAEDLRAIPLRFTGSDHSLVDHSLEREVEWEIIAARVQRGQMCSQQGRRLLPNSTLQLFTREVFAKCESSDRSDRISRIPGLGLVYAFGATRLGGFATLLFRTAALIYLIFKLDEIAPFLDHISLFLPDKLGNLILTMFLVAIIYGIWFAWNRSKIKPPTMKDEPLWPIPLISDDEVDWDVLWDGSTKRALELGNRICRTGLWSALWFRYLEKVPALLKKWLRSIRI